MKKFLSIAIIVIALGIAVVPVFTDCQSQGRSLTTVDGRSIPMKCHWAGIAEIGVAVPLALTGIFSLFKQRKTSFRTLSVIGISSGILAILFPTVLIGVCGNPDMVCNMIMRPLLVLGGSLAILAGFVQFLLADDPQIEMAQAAA